MVTSKPTWLRLPPTLHTLYVGVFGWGLVICLIFGVTMADAGAAAVLSPRRRLFHHNERDKEVTKRATFSTTLDLESYLEQYLLAIPPILLLIFTQLDVLFSLVSNGRNGNSELQSYVSAFIDEYSICLLTSGFTTISGVLFLAIVVRLGAILLGQMSCAGIGTHASWTTIDAIYFCVCFSACCMEWIVRAPLVNILQDSISAHITSQPMRPWDISTAASLHDDIVWWNNLLAVHAVVMLCLQKVKYVLGAKSDFSHSHSPVDAIISAYNSGELGGKTNDEVRTTTIKISKAECWASVESEKNVCEKECGAQASFTVGVQTGGKSLSRSCDTVTDRQTSASLLMPVTPTGVVVAEDVKFDSLQNRGIVVSLQPQTIDKPENVAKRRKTGAEFDDVKEACISESDFDGDATHGALEHETDTFTKVMHVEMNPIAERAEKQMSAGVSETRPNAGKAHTNATTDTKDTNETAGTTQAEAEATTDDTAETKAKTSSKARTGDEVGAKLSSLPRKITSSKPLLPEPAAAPNTRGDVLTEAMFGIAAAAGVMLLLGGTRRLLQRH